MGKTYRTVSTLLVLTFLAAGSYYAYQRFHLRRSGLLSERIEHDGNAWKARFTTRIVAPEQSVFDAIRDVENEGPGGVKRLRVLADTGNSKTVEMRFAAPGGQTIITRLAFRYFPSEHRITYQTVGASDFVTHAEYRLQPEGTSTLIQFHEVTTIRQEMPVPDAMVKRVIRDLFLAQLEELRHKLRIHGAESSQDAQP